MNELRGLDSTGNIEYFVICDEDGNFYNGTTFAAYSSGDYADYDVSGSEKGTSGIYFGNFPPGITAAGTYSYFMKRQQGASPAEDDPGVAAGKVDWTGTSAAVPSTGGMTGSEWRDYVLRGGFKRTDKDTEIYEETSDAIREMRRKFGFSEAEAETETTDTISVLGDYKISLESDFGLLLGVILIDGEDATPLIPRSKHTFDRLYPSNSNDPAFRGYPKDFCLYGGDIQIGPIPDQTSYEYRLVYSRRAGAVTSSTTSVPFTSEYRDVLRDLTQAKLYKSLDEFDKTQFFRSEFDRGFSDATRKERKNKSEGAFNVRPFGM